MTSLMIACTATLHQQGIRSETAREAALAAYPLAGEYAGVLIALGLLNASLFSAPSSRSQRLSSIVPEILS